MGKKASKMDEKKLCKLCKNDCLKKNLKEYIGLINEPAYICKKCGRAANKSKSLCKPEEI